MGTAQQEIPVAQLKPTSYAVNLTVEEMGILVEALRMLSAQWDQSMFRHGYTSPTPYEVDALLEDFKKAIS